MPPDTGVAVGFTRSPFEEWTGAQGSHLYNVAIDPEERNDLFNDPAHADVLEKIQVCRVGSGIASEQWHDVVVASNIGVSIVTRIFASRSFFFFFFNLCGCHPTRLADVLR